MGGAWVSVVCSYVRIKIWPPPRLRLASVLVQANALIDRPRSRPLLILGDP
jgi:hypothetical protein